MREIAMWPGSSHADGTKPVQIACAKKLDMQKDILQSIDDSALETVSGGHVGEIIAHIREHTAHVREHIHEAADFVGDRAGKALIHADEVLEAIDNKLAD